MFGWIFSSLLFLIIKFKVTVRKLRNYVLTETHPPHWLWSVPRWRLLQACDCCQGDYQRLKLLHRKLSSNRTLLKTLYRLKYRCLYRHANHLINTRNSLFYWQHRTRNVITNLWSVYGYFHGNLFMPSSLDITPESREQAWALKFCKRVTLNFWTLRKSSDCYLV